jgi:hypothetical protein
VSDDGFITSVVSSLSRALSPLADTDQLDGLLERLGWPAPSNTDVADQLTDASAAVERLVAHVEGGASAATLVAAVVEAITALGDMAGVALGSSAGAPYDDPAFWAAFPEDLLALLVSEALETNAPGVYGVLSFLGVLAATPVAADADTGQAAYVARTMDFAALIRSLTSPQTLMRDVYGWGDDFDHGRLLGAVNALGAGIGASAALMPLHRAFAEPFVAPDNPDRRGMKQLVVWPFALPGATLSAIAQPALVVTPLPPAGEPSSRPEGLLLSPTLTGQAQATVDLRGGATLSITGELQATPQRIGLRPSGATRELAAVDADLSARVDIAPPAPLLLGGTPEGTRFEVARAHLALAVSGADSDLVVEVEIGLDDALVVLDLSQGDSFVSGLIGAGRYELPMALEVGWSSQTGLHFSGHATPSFTVPVDLLIGGVLSVFELHVALGPGGTDGAAQLSVTATGSMLLGPLVVTFDRLGIAVATKAASFEAPGNFGLADISLGFDPPDGVGLAVDSGVASGGGYLYVEPDGGGYAGVLELELLGVGISAVALIDTDPVEVDGWSLFFALFIDVPAIPLGFGFNLTGVGGLVGINRTLDVDALQSAVRSGALDAVLFPENPIADAPIIIDQLQSIFPPAADSYVFGPVVQISWGTPGLIEAEIGIVIALPDPITIAVLGSVTSVLPTPDVDLVALHLDVAGVIDFAAAELSIDASLHDSHIIGFALSGDMALRASFGDQPSFLMSLGGFHPGFTAPPGFPDLRRLSLSINAGPIISIHFECYLALTSNTVQFGAALHLSATIAGFGIEGGTEFDALVQFTPFELTTRVAFEIAITAGPVDLAGVWLEATVTGPNPWYLVGTARFKILGIEEELRVDERIGQPRPEPELPAEDLFVVLLAALADVESWSVIASPSPGVVLADIEIPTGDLVASPDGLVAVNQRAVPLGILIDKAGNAPLAGHDHFTLEAGPGLEATGARDDWFAPGHFFEIPPGEQLSTPSFERLTSGLEFGGGPVVAGPARQGTLAYEEILRDPELDDEVTGRRFVPGNDPRPAVMLDIPSVGRSAAFAVAADFGVALVDVPYAVVEVATGDVRVTASTWSSARHTPLGRDPDHVVVPTWETVA